MNWLRRIWAYFVDRTEDRPGPHGVLTTEWHCWKGEPHEVITHSRKGETTRDMVCRHYAKVQAKKHELNRGRPHNWKDL